MEALLQAERREVERMRQRLFLDRLAFRRRVRETERKMAGMKINVVGVEKMGMVDESSNGEGFGEDGMDGGAGFGRAVGGGVEPYAEGMEGFMRHEI